MRIAFTGKLASGKTTAAKFLVDERDFVRMALADELKAIGAEIATWMHQSRVLSHEDRMRLLDKKTTLGRRWLQFLGTECLRSRLPDIWIQILLHKIRSSAMSKIVVDDARFLNEAQTLRQAGFLVVKVQTPEADRLARIEELYPQYRGRLEELSAHPSETEVDLVEPDVLIVNRGSLEDLKAEVLGINGPVVALDRPD